MKTPTLLVNKPEWSQFPYVVFDNDLTDCIPNEWVRDRFNDELERSKHYVLKDGDYEEVTDNSITTESVLESMEEEFLSQNAEIVHHWEKRKIVAVKGYYNKEFCFYRYQECGSAEHITDGSVRDLIKELK